MLPSRKLSILALPELQVVNPLESYLHLPDPSLDFKVIETRQAEAFSRVHVQMTSQIWHGLPWHHQVLVVSPNSHRNPGLGFLLVAGDGPPESHLPLLEQVAGAAGISAAVVTDVPNQPLFDGLVEDALVAHTFQKYAETKDPTWPLLFPMVKSAVRGMDVVQAVTRKQFGNHLEGFIVSGASKRGWATWLAGAVDARVKGIAPMVIDLLNLKAQMNWAAKVYGQPSEKIHDYTNKGLVERIDDPALEEMRGWIDPYTYRERYRMPKLILLGTNDPYWVVDALRHYWNDLPEPKLLYQTPNAGHDLAGGQEAYRTLSAFVQMIADGEKLPRFSSTFDRTPGGDHLIVKANVSPAAARFSLWTARSNKRDFREAFWSGREIPNDAADKVEAVIMKPPEGYQASLVEAEMETSRHLKYLLSTEARVFPDH